MNELLKEYAEVEAKFKILLDSKMILREQVLGMLKHAKKDKEVTDFGTFTVSRKTAWKYSPAVESLGEKLKIAQTKEQEKGLATPVVSEYLLFKPSKDE